MEAKVAAGWLPKKMTPLVKWQTNNSSKGPRTSGERIRAGYYGRKEVKKLGQVRGQQRMMEARDHWQRIIKDKSAWRAKLIRQRWSSWPSGSERLQSKPRTAVSWPQQKSTAKIRRRDQGGWESKCLGPWERLSGGCCGTPSAPLEEGMMPEWSCNKGLQLAAFRRQGVQNHSG